MHLYASVENISVILAKQRSAVSEFKNFLLLLFEVQSVLKILNFYASFYFESLSTGRVWKPDLTNDCKCVLPPTTPTPRGSTAVKWQIIKI